MTFATRKYHQRFAEIFVQCMQYGMQIMQCSECSLALNSMKLMEQMTLPACDGVAN